VLVGGRTRNEHILSATRPSVEAIESSRSPTPRRGASASCCRARCRARSTRRRAATSIPAAPIRDLPLCSTQVLPLEKKRDGHWVACHLRR
jgi:hypothetical protein